MRRAARGLAVAILLAIGAARPARAHQSSIAYSDIEASGRDVLYTIRIASSDLVEAVGTREVTPELLRARQAAVAAHIARAITVRNEGRVCAPALDGLDITTQTVGFFASIHLRYRCEQPLGRLEIEYRLFFDLDPRHQGFARADVGGGALAEFVFTAGERKWRIEAETSALASAGRYLVMGIEHIFTGYDHILFLVGLLLVAGMARGQARGLRNGFIYTLKIVTAFTIAHSITLIAAALGLVEVPPRISESGIALSIAYVGAENLARGDPKYRWLLTFAFGLVHGFGFATVLREIGLPRKGLLLSLLSFNVGVEIGQLGIVGLIFPILHVLATRQAAFYRRGVLVGGSGIIVVLGLFWLVERAFAVQLLGGVLG